MIAAPSKAITQVRKETNLVSFYVVSPQFITPLFYPNNRTRLRFLSNHWFLREEGSAGILTFDTVTSSPAISIFSITGTAALIAPSLLM